jgi:hypothetical protein
MSNTVRADTIRTRLESGDLTRERTPSHPDATMALQIGLGPAGDCDGCGEAIRPGDVYLTVASAPLLRMHDACEKIWEAERRR